MNPGTPRFHPRSLRLARAGLLLFAVLALAPSLQAQLTTDEINLKVYAQIHGLSDATVGGASWQNLDTDGDGQTNLQEVIAGTSYNSPASVIKVSSIAASTNPLYLDLTIPTANGKRYRVQGNVTLSGGVWADVTDPPPAVVGLSGDDAAKKLTVPKAGAQGFTFFRVLVSDAHSDGDPSGVSDWAKRLLGLAVKNKFANGLNDAFGAPIDDRTFVSNNLQGTVENFVTISAIPANSAATQPDTGGVATDPGVFTVRRGGLWALLGPLSVNVAITGTAVAGQDYTALPASVSFAGGQTVATIHVNPLTPPALRRGSMSVVATLASGSGYTIPTGNGKTAIVILHPSPTPAGTGLTGTYYTTASTTYSNAANFNAANVGLTRTDAMIDFANTIAAISVGNPCTVTMSRPHGLSSGVSVSIGNVANGVYSPTINATYTATVTGPNTFTVPVNCTASPITLHLRQSAVSVPAGWDGWGTLTGPTGMVGETDGVFSARWTGQIQSQYSEPHTFFLRSNDGVRLRVNGVDVIPTDWFVRTNLTDLETFGTINLTAGVKYDVILDYYSTGVQPYAALHLLWMSPSQPKSLIGSNRLYPASGATPAPPAITSASTVTGYRNQAFSFTVTASNLATPIPASTFALAAGTLPPGLSLNGQSGVISGTPTTAGEYQVAISVSKSGIGSTVGNLTLSILDTGNGFTREVWQGIVATTNIWDIPLTAPPTISDTVTPASATFEDNATYGNNYGVRLSGYLTVPVDGNYYFWLSANDSAELWISNDSEPVNKVRRATITGGSATRRQWTAQPSGKSRWLALLGGKKYYVEILHKALVGANNHVSVAWYQDPMGNSGTHPTAPVLPADISSGVATPRSATAGGCLPAYTLWKYYPTPPGSAQGPLYRANMLPSISGTQGSGRATLQMSADYSTATLSVSYAGLTGTKTQWHLHADAYKRSDGSLGAIQGQILYDLDVLPINPDGTFILDLTNPEGTTHADMLEILRQGKCYINIHTAIHPAGEIQGSLTQTNGSPTFTPPPNPPALTGAETSTDAGAARFLAQATFGPTAAEIADIKTNGIDAWLTDQFNTPVSHTSDLIVRQTFNQPFPGTLMWNAWWQRSVTAPDQLRHRVAYALSQILVVSDVGPVFAYAQAQAAHYDKLLDNAFGNFRAVLKDSTLQPAMGLYLDMINNKKGNITTGLHANENFAREINQLFSIGLNRMWPDGTLVMDSKGSLVPTYTQPAITGFSDALTGWSYYQADQAGTPPRLPNLITGGSSAVGNFSRLLPMKMTRYLHEQGSKLLLDNVVLPPISGYPQFLPNYGVPELPGSQVGTIVAGTPADLNTAETYNYIDPAHPENGVTVYNRYDVNGILDLDAAIESIFANSNVGPFICRQLIQRLVTSSPSPAYVYRVVQAFNGERNADGVRTNVRGDMKDTIKAILKDYEARSVDVLDPATHPTYGKQREPVLRVTSPARYFLPGASLPASGIYVQSTSFVPEYGSANERPPNRIKITTATPHRLNNSDTVVLQFNANATTAPAGVVPVSGAFVVRASDANNIVVESKETAQGFYSWDGTAITVGTSPISAPLPYRAEPGLSLFLAFMPDSVGGPVPASGEYAVLTADDTTRTMTVVWSPGGVPGVNDANPGAAFAGTQSAGPFYVTPRVTTDVSCNHTAGSTTAKVNYLVPHGLSTGDYVFLDQSDELRGRRQVTVQDAYNFTVQIPAPYFTATTPGLVVYDLKMPVLNRSGGNDVTVGALPAVAFEFSTWKMGATDGDSLSASLGQTPLRAQTVFNFYFPDYQYPGALAAAGATTPEFQLTDDSATMLLTNAIEQGILTGTNANGLSSFKNNSGAIVLDYSQIMPAGANQAGVNLLTGLTNNAAQISTLVDLLNEHLAGGALSSTTTTRIKNFVSNTAYFPAPSGSPATILTRQRDRMKAIVHMILTSPEYAIQK